MADKAITDLNTIPGSVDDNNTWFAVAQSGTAYKVSGHEFTLALGTILDGHGGIKTIVYTPPVAPSLTGTMVITLADNSTTTVSIQNGKGISSIAKTGTSGLVDTYTITYNDATTQTFSVTNGAKGDTGDSWYVWIKYAGSQPTQDSDMGDTPDNWIGIYSGTSSTAPTHYTSYDWFEYKGEKGDTGDAATITTQNVSYQESSSGTVAPSGSWTTTIPSVTPGNFLWTRTQLAFNDGTTVTSYSVSRYGIDGTGAVSTVNNISPDSNGNVALAATNVPMSDNQSVQTHVADAENDIADLKTSITNIQRDKRKVLFVGDSYGAQTDNWVDFCAAKLGLSSADYVNASVSGTGFIVDSASHIGSSYNGFLDELIATTADRNTFTDVVICGGINDAQYDTYQTFLGDHIRDCITYIKTYFPNARPHIGFIGGALENSSVLYSRTWKRRSVAKYAYISQAAPYYLSGVENVIHQSAWLYSSDGLHPNATGSELIGDAVAQAIKTGSVEIYQAEQSVNITAGTGTSVSTANAHLYFENDKAKFTIDIDFAAGASGNYGISAGLPFKLQDNLFFNKKATTFANSYCHYSGGGSGVLPLKVELYQDTITFFPVALSGSSWATFSIDVFGLPTGVDVVFPSDWIN